MSTTAVHSAPDGMDQFTRSWMPPRDPRASIVLVHGLGEHSGRYEHVGGHLAAAGFAVDATDLRGHGRSGGPRAHMESFDDVLDDLEASVARRQAPGVPFVLIGHSLGGLIAAAYTEDPARTRPDLLVLSAPAIDATLPKVKLVMARVLGRLTPKLAIPNGLSGDQLSRDPAVGEAYFGDSLVLTKTSARFGRESLAVMTDTKANVARLTLPLLVIHGAEDTIVPTASSGVFAGLPDSERVVFPGFRHESFNEEGGVRALETVTTWLDRRLGG